jgi:penicillin G amidase
MRIIPFFVTAIITALLIFALNKKWGSIPPVGKLLSPQHGFWQNAESNNTDFGGEVSLPGLKGKAEIFFDERLVPHVFAENDEDLYYLQGYLHAKFRLFQMDLQTKAAEGRASEIAGPRAIEYDKGKRRLGMRFAAENALKKAESDPATKTSFDAYTNGVNAWISSLTESSMPIEYKLLDFKPEKWSNIRTALLLTMMAEMLSSGTENDLNYTNAKTIFSEDELKLIYPQVHDSLQPIVPIGTVFPSPAMQAIKPLTADSLYIKDRRPLAQEQYPVPDKNNGSNNWVVSGSRTQSGSPILCNDPHLELSLPSIWYELQLHSPNSNTYGVSLPGSPFIIIGFNDSIAWGVTNAQRDVKDYYEIKFRDKTKREYWRDSSWAPVTGTRVETIKVRGGKTVYDTVTYTHYGPVMYDERFSTDLSAKRDLAVRWVAHDPSNTGMTFYKLNRAKNYADYEEAIRNFDCPAQNFVFASKTGDIAIWQQGKFPARWERQGLYVMPGDDSSFAWQGFIPQNENPHSVNPERGFLFSANQRPVDSAYPYFIPGSYITPRGVTIYNKLAALPAATVADMMSLQNEYFNSLAEDARPLLLAYTRENDLNETEKKYLGIVKNWDLLASPSSLGQTIYQTWWDSLESRIWRDELSQTFPVLPWPEEQTTMELLKRDSALKFIDDITTPAKESLFDIVTIALKQASVSLKAKEDEGKLEWAKFKNPTIYHLLKDGLPAFARKGLKAGGNGNIVNALTHSHGPSWRMVIHLTTPTEAYGVYPAGQSGNPGSRYYDNFVDTWVDGKYYALWMMRDGDKMDKKVKWVLKCNTETR